MEVLNMIANIFSLYYAHKITREERKVILQKNINPDMFNLAVSSLIDRGNVRNYSRSNSNRFFIRLL